MKRLFLALMIVYGCAPSPVMKQKDAAETFQPILDFMEYKPGMTVADVGAGSGAITIAMARVMQGSEIYVQDIDTSVLTSEKLKKLTDKYPTQNNFHVVIGTAEKTNLPDATFDLIYSNATTHNFTAFDSMMKDIGTKLKPGGAVYFRDSFKGDHGEGEFCSDPKCGRRLLTIDDFLAAMERNGFKLIKRTPDMSGYPVFGFSVSQL